MPRVPSFLLKKLYVKKSLKNVENGFQFEIKNILADATINSPIKITVDNKPVGEEAVMLRIGGKETSSSTISIDNPLDFKVKTQVVVLVKSGQLNPGTHKIEINTNSKEYGEISFTIKDQI